MMDYVSVCVHEFVLYIISYYQSVYMGGWELEKYVFFANQTTMVQFGVS